ncbi:MAG: hypothetical protein FWC87_01090 [Acidimicrobiaceae bacterium]|nr:hypothetical protein [Acidimicrobiaceae bacterium]
MALTGSMPTVAPGGIAELSLSMAGAVARAQFTARMGDARLQTLQKVPAPIVHTDLVPPNPNPPKPLIPLPGDPGAYATVVALSEDR